MDEVPEGLSPDKPFYMYYAPGATHAPHHVPAEWSDKYKGKFDQGWDKAPRRNAGAPDQDWASFLQNTKLAPKHKDIKDWETLSADEKKLFTTQMETYAGFAEHTDNEIGRLYQALEEIGPAR